MPEEIAVCLDGQGQISALPDGSKIAVYIWQQGGWSVVREKPVCLETRLGMQQLRRKMAEIIEFLGECRLFVGRSIMGIPYLELEKARFSIWEATGCPADVLDLVRQRAAQERETPEEESGPPAPLEISPGCYRLSLKEIQNKNAGLTSKQVLLPFLRQGDFQSLEIICSHTPPWLLAELQAGRLNGSVERTGDNEEKVIIIMLPRSETQREKNKL